MRICLVGERSPLDEARKVIAHHLLTSLSQEGDVAFFDLTRLASFAQWKRLKAFDADVVHYIPGASTYSFLVAKALQVASKNAKTVMFSALNPFRGFSYGLYYGFSSLSQPLVPFIKTDLVLVQSDDAETTYRRLGCDVKPFVCSGVDVQRFRPVPAGQKEELRKRYKIERDTFVVLHVGSVRKWRNVDCLKRIQEDTDNQVILVGRNSSRYEQELALSLQKAGIIVTKDYDPKIEELYALSDCYVFPTTDPVGSIDIPLSILEAMATGLPVVSTKFGGLPRFFDERGGFYYAAVQEFPDKLEMLKSAKGEVKTRELVCPYSWDKIAQNLLRVYRDLVS